MGFFWFPVHSYAEEELSGTGITAVFQSPSSWNNLHGPCIYSAVAVPLHSLGHPMDTCEAGEAQFVMCKT